VLRWRGEHLARQRPVLESTHVRFVRKVKPLFRCSEYESAVYAFFRRIDHVIAECPNSVGATQLLYKDMLNRLEAASPGSKLAFVRDFLHHGRGAFATARLRPRATASDAACRRMPACVRSAAWSARSRPNATADGKVGRYPEAKRFPASHSTRSHDEH